MAFLSLSLSFGSIEDETTGTLELPCSRSSSPALMLPPHKIEPPAMAAAPAHHQTSPRDRTQPPPGSSSSSRQTTEEQTLGCSLSLSPRIWFNTTHGRRRLTEPSATCNSGEDRHHYLSVLSTVHGEMPLHTCASLVSVDTQTSKSAKFSFRVQTHVSEPTRAVLDKVRVVNTNRVPRGTRIFSCKGTEETFSPGYRRNMNKRFE